MEQAEFEGVDADVRALRSELKKAEAALKRSKTKDYYNILGASFSLLEVGVINVYDRTQASRKTAPNSKSRKPIDAKVSSTTQTKEATRRNLNW